MFTILNRAAKIRGKLRRQSLEEALRCSALLHSCDTVLKRAVSFSLGFKSLHIDWVHLIFSSLMKDAAMNWCVLD